MHNHTARRGPRSIYGWYMTKVIDFLDNGDLARHSGAKILDALGEFFKVFDLHLRFYVSWNMRVKIVHA